MTVCLNSGKGVSVVSMNKQNTAAYDLSLFEPESKKKNSDKEKLSENKNDSKVIKLDTDNSQKSQRRRHNPLVIMVISLLTIAVAAVSAFIVYNNVVINELNEKILSSNKIIENQTNLEAQYQLKIDSKLTSDIVQDYAENKLGMTQVQNAQKEFVELADGDQGKVVREDGKDSVFDSMGKLFNFS